MFTEGQRTSIYFDFYSFSDCFDPKRLLSSSDHAEYIKNRAQELIKDINDYQLALYNRFQELQEMQYEKIIIIERRYSHYDKKVTYYVRYVSNPAGIDLSKRKYLEIEHFEYAGNERHLAFRQLEKLKKQYNAKIAEIGLKRI